MLSVLLKQNPILGRVLLGSAVNSCLLDRFLFLFLFFSWGGGRGEVGGESSLCKRPFLVDVRLLTVGCPLVFP